MLFRPISKKQNSLSFNNDLYSPRIGENVDISDAEQPGWSEVFVKNKQLLVLKR
jgi:hypothetical protein